MSKYCVHKYDNLSVMYHFSCHNNTLTYLNYVYLKDIQSCTEAMYSFHKIPTEPIFYETQLSNSLTELHHHSKIVAHSNVLPSIRNMNIVL